MTPTQRKAMQDAIDYINPEHFLPIAEEVELADKVLEQLHAALAEPAPEPVAWNGLTDVQWMNIVNKNSAWLGYSVEDAVHEAVRLTEARLKANNAAPVLGAAPKPVASIYITPDGQREFDDWKVALPVGRNELYAAPVREPAPVPLLTDDEIERIYDSSGAMNQMQPFARAIEQAVRQNAGL